MKKAKKRACKPGVGAQLNDSYDKCGKETTDEFRLSEVKLITKTSQGANQKIVYCTARINISIWATAHLPLP